MTANESFTYLIEFQPTGYFFFGSEQSFNTKERDKYNEELMNYYAKSNYYPQQTTILGALRYLILVLNNKLNASDKESYIGEKNFNGEHSDSYGKLTKISPLVIVDDNTGVLTVAPFSKTGNDTEISVDFSTEPHYLSGTKIKTPVLSNFDHKKFYVDVRWEDQFGVIQSGIYEKPLTKVGLEIGKEEDGFYRQTLYKLKPAYKFGVWVTFSEALPDYTSPVLLPFGGDQTMAGVSWRKSENIFNETQVPTSAITLLSDAFVNSEVLEDIDFAINEYTDFRYIHSKKASYYKLNNQTDKSDKLLLMKRGSVLYSENAERLAIAIRKQIAYRNIGYNYFKYI